MKVGLCEWRVCQYGTDLRTFLRSHQILIIRKFNSCLLCPVSCHVLCLYPLCHHAFYSPPVGPRSQQYWYAHPWPCWIRLQLLIPMDSLTVHGDKLGVHPSIVSYGSLSIPTMNLSQERFKRIWEMEIKCGNIYQLTFLKEITTHRGLYFPISINYSGTSFDPFPNGIARLIEPNSIPLARCVQLGALVGVLQCTFTWLSSNMAICSALSYPSSSYFLISNPQTQCQRNWQQVCRQLLQQLPNFGYNNFDEEIKLSKRIIEFNNGCADRLSIFGLVVHDEITPLSMTGTLSLWCFGYL